MYDISGMVGTALLCAAAVGGAVVLALVYVVPWLWELVKPLLHAVTA